MTKPKKNKNGEKPSSKRLSATVHEIKHSIRANWAEHALWEKWLNGIMICTLSLLFTWLVLHSTIIEDLFQTNADIESPELIDLYIGSAYRIGVPKYSNIIIMPIDGCSRKDITSALEKLCYMHPTAIGVDVIFPYYLEGDERLVETILENNNIVMASSPQLYSYFEPILKEQSVRFGSIVLEAETRHDIIRSFQPLVSNGADSIWSFETYLARLSGANMTKFYPYEQQSYIKYCDLLLDTLYCRDFLAQEVEMSEMRKRIQDKIVLLGDISDSHDFYRTPIDANMPGLMIHTYTLDTILRSNRIAISPYWINWLVAAIVSIFFAFLMLYYKWGLNDAEGLVMRVTQIVLMVIVVVLPGVLLFVKYHIYFDFSPALLTLSIQAFVLDIWVGLMALIKHII